MDLSISRMRRECSWMLKRLLEGCLLGHETVQSAPEFVLHKDLLSGWSIALRVKNFQKGRKALESFLGTG